MKKLFAIFALISLFSFNLNAQDTIVLKNNGKPDTVFCKIKSTTASNVFYIEKGEHKSEYMSNVKYFSKSHLQTIQETKVIAKNLGTSDKSEEVLKQSVWTVLGIFKIRSKAPTTPMGYTLTIVYSLPQSGFTPLLAKEPTFYVYRKK